MHVDLEPKRTKHIQPSPYLHQTAYWGRLKKRHGFEARAFDIFLQDESGRRSDNGEAFRQSPGPSEEASSDMLVVLRSLGREAQMAYVPFGPEFLPDEEQRGLWLEHLSERLRPHLPDSCLFIRFDLPWISPWVEDESRYTADNQWCGEPKTRVQEMRMNFDTEHWNLRKAPTDLLPKDTVILDVSAAEDRILQRMKPKTRYNIRLSTRKGVRVREAGLDELPLWYELYCETAERHSMLLNDIDYFRSALLTEAGDSSSPARVRLLLAEVSGRPIAGIIAAFSGKRATYLYGASSSRSRGFMAPHALQWAAICMARKAGCSEYDLFGISPSADPSHPMYGLYRFKIGFGGRIVHRQGCWDYPFDEERYEMFRTSEMRGPAFAGS